MEIFRAIITVLYAGTGVAAVVGYLPTIRDLSRGVASANIHSYVIWTITTGIGFLYATVRVSDPLLMIITGLNMLLCAVILVMVVRMRLRRAHEDRVRHYYRRNTGVFRLVAVRGASGPMPVHRAIAGGDGREATNTRLVAESRGYASCLDLGCGEGATLAALAREAPSLSLAGMTLSPAQARIARRHFAATGRRVAVAVASYLDPASYPALPGPRLLVAVESMVHAADRVSFLRAAAAYARPGDTLVVVDDFVAEGRGGARDPAGRRLVRAAMAGWRAPSLCRASDFVRQADGTGWRLERGEDWSARVPRGGRWARAAARLLVPLAPLPLGEIGAGLVGGSALLTGYRWGVFRYRYLVFRRSASA